MDISTISWPVLISFFSLLIAIGTFLNNQFGVISNIKERLAGIEERLKPLTSLPERVTCAETKIEVFWRSLAEQLSVQLHSSHTPQLDQLLERGISCNYNLDEEYLFTLRNYLTSLSQDPKEDLPRRTSAGVLLSCLESLYPE